MRFYDDRSGQKQDTEKKQDTEQKQEGKQEPETDASGNGMKEVEKND